MEVEVEGFSHVRVDGEVGRGEAGGGCGETRGGGGDAGKDVAAGGVGGGAWAVFDCDCCVGEGCSGGVEDGAFDAEAVGAALRSGMRGKQEENGKEWGHSPWAECDSVLHVDLMVGVWG
jgi:hypothetical protein